MFGIDGSEFLIIAIVAVLVLGPEHLPRVTRTFARIMSEFRRVSTEFQRTLNLEAHQQDEYLKRQQEQAAALKKKKKKKIAPPAQTEDAQDAPVDELAAENDLAAVAYGVDEISGTPAAAGQLHAPAPETPPQTVAMPKSASPSAPTDGNTPGDAV